MPLAKALGKRKIDALAGYAVWCLANFRVPIHWRWYHQGNGVFRHGLLDDHWEEKGVFEVYRQEDPCSCGR